MGAVRADQVFCSGVGNEIGTVGVFRAGDGEHAIPMLNDLDRRHRACQRNGALVEMRNAIAQLFHGITRRVERHEDRQDIARQSNQLLHHAGNIGYCRGARIGTSGVAKNNSAQAATEPLRADGGTVLVGQIINGCDIGFSEGRMMRRIRRGGDALITHILHTHRAHP